MRSDFGSFNPVTSSGQYDLELMNYALFTPIVQYDEDLHVQPYLAESWEMHGDTGVTFQLRQDVRWHDGQPVTARDVEFTFNLAKDEQTASLLGTAFLAEVDERQVTDDHTITFRFAQPHAQALEDFWWPPLPRHLLENVSPAELRNAPFNRQPVGSGPFRFGEWRANEQLVLVRNDDFPGGAGWTGRCGARRVPCDSGGVDDADGADHRQRARRHPADAGPGPAGAGQRRDGAAFVPGPHHLLSGLEQRPAAVQRREVRRALALAIDRDEIVTRCCTAKGGRDQHDPAVAPAVPRRRSRGARPGAGCAAARAGRLGRPQQ
jgi:ABC-type transport system substrate-binding protein